MIEDGTIVNIESSGVRGKIGDAISHGKLKGLATIAATAAVSAPSRPARPMWTSLSSAHLPAMSMATAPAWAARPTAAS